MTNTDESLDKLTDIARRWRHRVSLYSSNTRKYLESVESKCADKTRSTSRNVTWYVWLYRVLFYSATIISFGLTLNELLKKTDPNYPIAIAMGSMFLCKLLIMMCKPRAKSLAYMRLNSEVEELNKQLNNLKRQQLPEEDMIAQLDDIDRKLSSIELATTKISVDLEERSRMSSRRNIQFNEIELTDIRIDIKKGTVTDNPPQSTPSTVDRVKVIGKTSQI